MYFVNIRARLAVFVVASAVPAYIGIGAVEHQKSLAGIDVYLVIHHVIVTRSEQVVAFKAIASSTIIRFMAVVRFISYLISNTEPTFFCGCLGCTFVLKLIT